MSNNIARKIEHLYEVNPRLDWTGMYSWARDYMENPDQYMNDLYKAVFKVIKSDEKNPVVTISFDFKKEWIGKDIPYSPVGVLNV